MRTTIPYARWKRVRYQLKMIRLKDTSTSVGKKLRNYAALLNPPNPYPRIHFVVREQRQAPYITVHYHVDTDRHISDMYHPKLDRITNLLKNS